MGKSKVSEGFAPLSARQWKQQLQYELQGEDYNKALVWESPEGIKVKPFYTEEDLGEQGTAAFAGPGAWKLAQSIRVTTPQSANEVARHALGYGAEALQFEMHEAASQPELLLQGIDLKNTPLHFRLHSLQPQQVDSLLASATSPTKGMYLHLDPIGRLAARGHWQASQREDLETLRMLLRQYRDTKGLQLLGVDGSLYQNAGANRVQQLAYMLAHANEYLHILGDAGHAPPVFTVAVGSDFFFEIAKLRALRLLWGSLAAEYKLPEDCHIVAIPSRRNKTLYDYNTNMLRTTAECMSAILGNANTLVNLPYDALYREPNDFSARMARNPLLILKHEAHFGAVANPAEGAYYIESLTWQLAEKGLALFKQLEAGGGFIKQLKEHQIQKKVRESADREQKLFDDGRLVLVGTNAHLQEGEQMKGQMERNPFKRQGARKTLIEPLLEKRLASGLEEKRLANE